MGLGKKGQKKRGWKREKNAHHIHENLLKHYVDKYADITQARSGGRPSPQDGHDATEFYFYIARCDMFVL
ncbi:hypothetical protein N7449_011018 [Penicillium cf. viridicatum]|uniref:Uncharacterized protein n=1 Tax=Penicillium cf. viridicatum TaxID=2972119 RepID=A0A9W9IWC4_9EURO|nr:hypothetical protein N7449_011018 [Penicillium cf. viridicatum]